MTNVKNIDTSGYGQRSLRRIGGGRGSRKQQVLHKKEAEKAKERDLTNKRDKKFGDSGNPNDIWFCNHFFCF